MKNILLYTTEACHLCELALEQMEQSRNYENCSITEIDIASDVELLRQFATKVPLVSVSGSNNYLFWPFDHYQFTQWLEKA